MKVGITAKESDIDKHIISAAQATSLAAAQAIAVAAPIALGSTHTAHTQERDSAHVKYNCITISPY
ncbi:hypothetical protein CsSME_00023538 [Camellia sinensis var. sinensis]